ncbi:MAG: hypothetical protein AAF998_11440 [Bacteroidota bacterium]
MDNEARIKISLSEGKFEISGSEGFVDKQFDKLQGLIEKRLEKAPVLPVKPKNEKPAKGTENPAIVTETTHTENGLDQYDHIFVDDDDEDRIRIVVEIPGKNKVEKTQNAALIYAFANLQKGIKDVSISEIRAVCKHHGFLDTGNFASSIKKGDPKNYIIKGKSGSSKQTLKLTRVGETASKALVDELLKNFEE